MFMQEYNKPSLSSVHSLDICYGYTQGDFCSDYSGTWSTADA